MYISTYKVNIGKTCKRVSLQRGLVSLIRFNPEKVTFQHLLTLYENMLWFQEKCTKDPQFKDKFGLTLKVLAYILKQLDLRTITLAKVKLLSKKIDKNLKHFCLEKRNYDYVLKQQWKFVEVRTSQPLGKITKELPSPRYIGVGYRDKGSAKKPEYDASPSWQEVASSTIKELK